jgi:ABC-2 type transport system permease protein
VSNIAISPRRIGTMVLRYWYVLRGSWPRILDLTYWPTLQMIVWGFMTQFLASNSSYVAQAFGVLLSAVLLWDVLFRGQIGLSISFLEDVWSRNLGHLFVSPLRPIEMAIALMTMSMIRTLIGIVPATLLAIYFFGFSVYSLGLYVAGFFLALIMFGWSIGLAVSGLVMRYGMGAESLAWASIMAIMPLSAVYYPVETFPVWLRPLAWAMPPAHVFEGMRAILVHGQARPDLLLGALALDAIYLVVGFGAFLLCFHAARQRGRLLQTGE